jgi:cysteine synthase A|tara:strand:- start:5328 stop:6284 length:957 start_codon:yes stop_codon:yes gene_type:complete
MIESYTARGRIYDNITQTVGGTPLIRLDKIAAAHDCKAQLLGKCEFFNPLSSVKDRIGLAMIEALEAEGHLTPGATVIEPTSGNTGIALAFVCAAKGYKLILTMPETMSMERRKMLKLLGAQIVLTEGPKAMNGAIAKAHELLKEIPGSVMPQQFENPANPDVHARTTALEIWDDTEGAVDAVISGVGTGGTLTGVGLVLKEKKASVQMVAVEPEDSPVLSGGERGPHKIQGIGAGFIPPILQTELIDEVLRISNDTAFRTARQSATLEGLPVGISSGAAIAAGLEYGKRPENEGKMVIVVLPSFAERYLSTPLFEGL